jgi:Predicted integral membrane protein
MKKLSIFLCILWMGVIFYNSNNSGEVSNKTSYAFLSTIEKTEEQIKKVTTHVKSEKQKLNVIIRKNGHFIEYFILALLIGIAFFTNDFKGKKAIVYILFICLFYAITDEFHQKFVQGRTSDVGDVLIDFGGAVAGTIIYYFTYYKIYIRRKNVSRKLSD